MMAMVSQVVESVVVSVVAMMSVVVYKEPVKYKTLQSCNNGLPKS